MPYLTSAISEFLLRLFSKVCLAKNPIPWGVIKNLAVLSYAPSVFPI